MKKREPFWVACRGGCGRKEDLSVQVGASRGLGFKGRNPTFLCHECNLKEEAAERAAKKDGK